MEQEKINNFCGLCQKDSITKLLSLFLAILSIFFLVKIYGSLKENSFIGQDIYPQTTINVTGEGEMSAVPDIATFTFSITKENLVVKTAQEEVEKVMASVLNSLKEAGVEEKDIKTTNYNIYPRYEWKNVGTTCYGISCPTPGQTRELVGYEVSQNISVKLRDINKAGEILSNIGGLGVTNVSGLSFEVDDKDELKREAREKAIQEAQDKAQKLAKDLDVKLVRIVSYSSNEGDESPVYYAEDMAYGLGRGEVVSSPASIPVGEDEIKVVVYLTYEIK